MSTGQLTVCVIGAGPRGLSVLERLCANERKSASCTQVTVHVVDPARPGAGRVWRTDQPRELLMNTVASQVTVYTDDSVEMTGPVETGPSLFEWARALSELNQLEQLLGGYDDSTLAEARGLGANSYPTRALFGRYLEDAFRQVVTSAPEHITIMVHRSSAVALWDAGTDAGSGKDTSPHTAPDTRPVGDADPGAGSDADTDRPRTQTVLLADGTRLTGLDAVVLALGHLPSRQTPDLATAASAVGLVHVAPANPADLDLSHIAPGERVLLRGLGLNFFDLMVLLTVGRGGAFERHRGKVRYRPSGREPRMYAGSRRGIPYHARAENQKGAYGRHTPRLLTPRVIQELTEHHRRGDRLYFSTALWPLIAREVESVYYETLLASHGRDADRTSLVEEYLRAPDDSGRTAVLHRFGIAEADHWRWELIAHPDGEHRFTSHDDFRHWLLQYLERDIRRARGGNVGDPHKAALDVLRDLRNEIRLVVDHAGLDGDSHRDELDGWYTGFNAFLSIGPPASRIEEMVALIESGILDVVGPGIRVDIDGQNPAFVASSPAVADTRYRASVLIEARLPEPDLRQTADPLLRHLRETRQCRPFRIPAGCGRTYETGGLEVTPRPYHVVDALGRAHPRRFAFGVPTEAVHWVTAAGARPGVNSVSLGDSDAIARAVLALPPTEPAVRVPMPEGVLPAGRLTEVRA
ncbi:FAD/NAD(P)-binding protein [Streptomyces sp. NPDC002677]|uniref:FAD/NAD(P)-binding protein n=1 Tax=Streptomyces sp. NPDC002677 TaxID=3154774 RepID=UPI00331AAB8F